MTVVAKEKRVNPERLSTSELVQMIKKNRQVEECKQEWKDRWGHEYPMYQVGNEVKSYI